MPSVVSVDAAVYGIPEESVGELPVHRGLDDDGRIVYRMTEKELALPGLDRPPPEGGRPPRVQIPPALSAVVMTPTAYRRSTSTTPRASASTSTLYFIGRLYGKNNLSTRQTNFIRPAGRLEPLGRRQDAGQSETDVRPAMAVGAGHLHLPRLAPARHRPAQRHRQRLGRHARAGETYVVIRRSSGSADQRRLLLRQAAGHHRPADRVPLAAVLQFTLGGLIGPGQDTVFGSVLFCPKLPAGVEVIRPSGMPLQPSLQLQAGLFLKLNFDLSTCASGAAGMIIALPLPPAEMICARRRRQHEDHRGSYWLGARPSTETQT